MLRRRDLSLALLAALAPGARGAFAQSRVIEAPIRIDDQQRVLIDVKLEGRGPYVFRVATMASLPGIRDDLAVELGLKRLPELRSRRPERDRKLYQVQEMVLGGTVRQAGVGLYGLTYPQPGLDGELAAGLLTSLDSELDFRRGVWRVWPSGGADRAGFTRLDVSAPAGERMPSGRMAIDVTVGDTKLKPLLDSGLALPLLLDTDRARDMGLWDDAKPYAIGVLTRGTRAPEPVRFVRAASLGIGGLTYKSPIVAVRTRGARGDDLLGVPILRTLDLSFERGGKALWIRHNGSPALTVPYRASGIWLDEAKGADVRVSEVATGSPAAVAGVKPGDVIEGDFKTVVALVDGPVGSPVTLTLRRDGQARTVTFTPKAYL